MSGLAAQSRWPADYAIFMIRLGAINSCDTQWAQPAYGCKVLVRFAARRHGWIMFCVTEVEAAAIRTVFFEDGELSAAIALRRMFPGIADNMQARLLAQQIAGWQRPTPQLATNVVVRLRPS